MKQRIWWGRSLEGEALEDLESRLRETLQPVTPRPGFVREMRRKLSNYPSPAIEPDSRLAQTALIVVGALVSGVLLAAMGVRALLALAGALSALVHLRRSPRQTSTLV